MHILVMAKLRKDTGVRPHKYPFASIKTGKRTGANLFISKYQEVDL
jgi:hypothetical protein